MLHYYINVRKIKKSEEETSRFMKVYREEYVGEIILYGNKLNTSSEWQKAR